MSNELYRQRWEEIFGKDREPQRGFFVFDEARGEFVRIEDYRPLARALDAPIMAGRFYENTSAETIDEHGKPITVDIGSRSKHSNFMRERGLTTLDDFAKVEGKKMELGTDWARAAREREAVRRGENDRKERREEIARQVYLVEQAERRRKR